MDAPKGETSRAEATKPAREMNTLRPRERERARSTTAYLHVRGFLFSRSLSRPDSGWCVLWERPFGPHSTHRLSRLFGPETSRPRLDCPFPKPKAEVQNWEESERRCSELDAPREAPRHEDDVGGAELDAHDFRARRSAPNHTVAIRVFVSDSYLRYVSSPIRTLDSSNDEAQVTWLSRTLSIVPSPRHQSQPVSNT